MEPRQHRARRVDFVAELALVLVLFHVVELEVGEVLLGLLVFLASLDHGVEVLLQLLAELRLLQQTLLSVAGGD